MKYHSEKGRTGHDHRVPNSFSLVLYIEQKLREPERLPTPGIPGALRWCKWTTSWPSCPRERSWTWCKHRWRTRFLSGQHRDRHPSYERRRKLTTRCDNSNRHCLDRCSQNQAATRHRGHSLMTCIRRHYQRQKNREWSVNWSLVQTLESSDILHTQVRDKFSPVSHTPRNARK